MKISFKLSDIEVTIEDQDEKDRSKLIQDSFDCLNGLIKGRIDLQAFYDTEPAEDMPGDKPAFTEHKIRPDMPTMDMNYV